MNEIDKNIDPARYEIFLHRLYMIGEEGRISLQKVTASPIVAQGGECMTAFYDESGVMVIACTGHLRFAMTSSEAIKKIIEWQGEDINNGDQFFINDPYVATAHTYDQTLVKPIFYEGQRIAWVATSSHTADTGGALRGLAKEIYDEGIRIQGLRVMDSKGLREDAFRAIVNQCRDPEYVGLDLKGRIAANNVAERRFLQMVEKFGADFVRIAFRKIVSDSTLMAKAKLRKLPNGVWQSISYGATQDVRRGLAKPYRVYCTVRKNGDSMEIDFAGSSPNNDDDMNATLTTTKAMASVPLIGFLFWDVAWSDGLLSPIKMIVPERTLLNCPFPAACSFAPVVGNVLMTAVSDCIARMVYASGLEQYVNAAWHGTWYRGGPGYFYAGHDRKNLPIPQGLYDIHGSGLGAAPFRDGVPAGGHVYIPSAGISDVERIELQYPFLYFTRNLCRDGGGFGKYAGGTGTQRIFMVYGSHDFSVNFIYYLGLPESAKGLFGGYPTGTGGVRAIYQTDPDLVMKNLAKGDYPYDTEKLTQAWGKVLVPKEGGRLPLAEYTILTDYVGGGGGYGDPLDRDPELVLRDLHRGIISPTMAKKIYGVVVEGGTLSREKTLQSRDNLRKERSRIGVMSASLNPKSTSDQYKTVLRFHEYLEVASDGRKEMIRCIRCGYLFCDARNNYKKYSRVISRDPHELTGKLLPSNQGYSFTFKEYVCPQCLTLLEVDLFCPILDKEMEPIWDFEPLSERETTVTRQPRT